VTFTLLGVVVKLAQKGKLMKVSVILPTYNEAGNIVELVKKIKDNIPSDWDYEIIVVDDNSPDQTFDIVQEAYQDDLAVISHLRTKDRGFAKSIRAGIDVAQGDQILVMDSDFTHDPMQISKMLHVSKVCDIVIGSRFCAGGNMQDAQHYYTSLLYNWFARITIRTQVQDNLGGYFTISRQKLDLLPFDHIFLGFGEYFIRFIYYAQRKNMQIIEIPIVYNLRRKGTKKSHVGRMLFSYTLAMLKLKLNWRCAKC